MPNVFLLEVPEDSISHTIIALEKNTASKDMDSAMASIDPRFLSAAVLHFFNTSPAVPLIPSMLYNDVIKVTHLPAASQKDRGKHAKELCRIFEYISPTRKEFLTRLFILELKV